jgi:RNA polymerase sigma-70 factor (sigma-E family)
MRVEVEEARIEGSVLEDLYARNATGAIRLAYLLTGDRGLAEDLVQDAFVRLTGRLLHVRNPGGFHAYLRATVINLARAHHRRMRVERRFLERRTANATSTLPDVSEREALRQALLALPIRQRTALVLRFYEDLSEAETAALMRCRPGTVKSLVSRGKETLRSTIGDD